MKRPSLPQIAVAIATVPVLAACGGGDAAKKPQAASQVAVKVNKDEISVHQVNAQLVRLGATAAAQQATAKKQVVEDLIDQQLLVQQAREQRLDRDPEVLAALESARQSILAQAYVQKRVTANARPNEEDVRKYYLANPALFSERRVYRIVELATDLKPERLKEVEERIAKGRSMVDLGNEFRAAGVQVAPNAAVRAPEQLPMDFVNRIAAMKDGQIVAFSNDRSITILQVVESQKQPLNETEAAPLIEQFLTNQKREQLAKSEIKRLRDAASIEFVGDFTKLTQAAGEAPAAAAKEAGAGGTAAGTDAKALEKGVSGLR